MNYKKFIEDVLKSASEIANSNFGKVEGKIKPEDNNQVLTEIDIEIGNFIISKVKETFPSFNIIDEEAGVIDNKSEYTWVIDPIDGTSNFACGVPTYGIMIGLLKGNASIAGGVALPFFTEIIIAQKNKGAYSNKDRISVSTETNLLNTLVAFQIDGHRENPEITRQETKMLADIILNSRNARTSNCVYDTVMVAKGKYGGCINKSSKIWDNVAQQIIIEEAGGIYTDFYGKPIDYSSPLMKINQNYTFCAASPILHNKLQEIIKNT